MGRPRAQETKLYDKKSAPGKPKKQKTSKQTKTTLGRLH